MPLYRLIATIKCTLDKFGAVVVISWPHCNEKPYKKKLLGID